MSKLSARLQPIHFKSQPVLLELIFAASVTLANSTQEKLMLVARLIEDSF
ncbi:hypothetical protein [Psychrobacter sp. P2G3]|nr:hypothetical protein [Psychrobacter sp. P2G3]